MACCAFLAAIFATLFGAWRRLTGRRPATVFAPVARRPPPGAAPADGMPLAARTACPPGPASLPSLSFAARSPAPRASVARSALFASALLALLLAGLHGLPATAAVAHATLHPEAGSCALPLTWQEYADVAP